MNPVPPFDPATFQQAYKNDPHQAALALEQNFKQHPLIANSTLSQRLLEVQLKKEDGVNQRLKTACAASLPQAVAFPSQSLSLSNRDWTVEQSAASSSFMQDDTQG